MIGLRYTSEHGLSNKLKRALWGVVWLVLVRPCPRFCRAWPRFWLKLFGARLAPTASVAPSCRVWAPWNLEMGAYASLSDQVNCYNVAPIILRDRAIVSPHAHLCAAGHDMNVVTLPLLSAPIVLQPHAWVGMAAFVGMGVTLEEGAVAGAFAGVFKDVPAWKIVGGNPAKVISERSNYLASTAIPLQ